MKFLDDLLENHPVIAIALIAGFSVAIFSGLGVLGPLAQAVAKLKAGAVPASTTSGS